MADIIGPDCWAIIMNYKKDLEAVELHREQTFRLMCEYETKVNSFGVLLESQEGRYHWVRMLYIPQKAGIVILDLHRD